MSLFDSHANFAKSSVATAPTPAISGPTLIVNSGDGTKFTGIPPYNCTVSDGVNSEIVRVTAVSGDTFTISRGQEGIPPIAIKAGMTIQNTITKKTLTDIEAILATVSHPPIGTFYNGFGVVYQNRMENVAADIALFKANGLKAVRISLPIGPVPWSPGLPVSNADALTGLTTTGIAHSNPNNYAYWRLMAQQFINDGSFTTIFGMAVPEGFGHTYTAMSNFMDSMVAEAQYMISINMRLSIYELGNELENQLDGGVTITIPQLNALLRATATRIKALPGWTALGTKIGYGLSMNGTSLNDWLANGLGDLDALGIHPYGQINITDNGSNRPNPDVMTQTYGSFIISQYQALIDANIGHIYIGEFNLDFRQYQIIKEPDSYQLAQMQIIRDSYILPNVSKLMFNTFCIYKYATGFNSNPGDLGWAVLLPSTIGYYPFTLSGLWSCFFQ